MRPSLAYRCAERTAEDAGTCGACFPETCPCGCLPLRPLLHWHAVPPAGPTPCPACSYQHRAMIQAVAARPRRAASLAWTLQGVTKCVGLRTEPWRGTLAELKLRWDSGGSPGRSLSGWTRRLVPAGACCWHRGQAPRRTRVWEKGDHRWARSCAVLRRARPRWRTWTGRAAYAHGAEADQRRFGPGW